MGAVLLGTAIGFGVGIAGTGLGGLSGLFFPGLSPSGQGGLLSLSSGVMLGVVFWDLYPEFWRLGPAYGLGGFLAGLAFILLVRGFWGREERRRPERNGESCETFAKFTRTGVLLGIGIGAHNFPEGVAVGTVFVQAPFSRLWWGLALLMAVHNIPEGLAMTAALKLGRTGWRKIIYALLLVKPQWALAFFGGLLGRFRAGELLCLGLCCRGHVSPGLLELLPLPENNPCRSVLAAVATGLFSPIYYETHQLTRYVMSPCRRRWIAHPMRGIHERHKSEQLVKEIYPARTCAQPIRFSTHTGPRHVSVPHTLTCMIYGPAGYYKRRYVVMALATGSKMLCRQLSLLAEK